MAPGNPVRRREGWDVTRVNYLTSTTFEITGYRVVENLGVVRGVVVRSRSIIGTGLAALNTVFGGNIMLFTELCEKTRGDAFDKMVAHASDIGGNAVIGVRYDATDIMRGVTEVLCYGTAVVVEAAT
ncbi:MAG TPA: heavy metal-binding domain-containing protein [Gemmatimonadales bacterium]